MGHLLHLQPWDLRRLTIVEFYDRCDWVDDYLTARKDGG